jgi:uncharacterized membrane protein YhaH (DUF805 family)
MAFCANCGTKLDEGAKFCLQCGTPAGGTVQPAAPVQGQVTEQAAAAVQPAVYQQPNINPPQAGQGAYSPPVQVPPVAKGWQYYWGMFKKYAVFRGRASMEEYLAGMFVNLLLLVFVFGFLDELSKSAGWYAFDYTSFGELLMGLYSFAVCLPLLAVSIRRMHDVGKSGWYLLIPVYGWVILPLCEGTKGPNRFGPDPKEN